MVVSGPSGAGKTTVLERVLGRVPAAAGRSVSATTRPPRQGEEDGVDYHFLTPAEFDARKKKGEFVECFEVFGRGYWYGTLLSEVATGLAAGKWVVLNIDVKGAGRYGTLPQRHEHLPAAQLDRRACRRLVGRGTESEEAIQQRLDEAKHELTLADRYRYQVINDDVDQAVKQICNILTNQWEADQHA